ncbi:hypothetical protein AAFO92_00900 [Roseovarius sp. CAU 1744]|uniref:hypothetical protein n=1 Tax=Roseovarius sp. CAU 1744 TaxID=3140368 RepID=UPI00325A6A8E
MNFTYSNRVWVLVLLAINSFGMQEAAWANSKSPWIELTQACESVIVDQSFQPLEKYKPAPFTIGLPGIKEYSVYSATQNLVAIARIERGTWVQCLVREHEESRVRWKDLAKEWSNGFEAGFPKPAYLWVEWKYHPERPFVGAVKCRGEDPAILISPNLETDLFFRVAVISAQHSNTPLCEKHEDS